MNRKKKIILVAIVLLVSLMYFAVAIKNNSCSTSIEITQLKTNTSQQMMGYFIKEESGKIIIIDGGNTGDSEALENYINENGGKVDYWFVTHFHNDHTGALVQIIENTDIQIDHIVCKLVDENLVEKYEENRISQYQDICNALENERIKDKVIIPTDGQVFELDNNENLKIKVLSVCRNDITNNIGNNSSMVFKLYINDKSILFLGDTGTESSEYLLQNCEKDLKSDYVQMSHHGQQGATFELYKAINPSYCFWPTPDWLWDNDIGEGFNTANFKTIETREWIENLNVKENYIEKDGDITVLIK